MKERHYLHLHNVALFYGKDEVASISFNCIVRLCATENNMSEEVVKFLVQWKSETNKFILCTASFSTEEYLQEYIKHRNITPIKIWRERSTLVDGKVVSVVKENYEKRN